MHFKVKRSKWTTPTCVKRMQKVANHIFSHYPKDKELHKAFCEAWWSTDQAGTKAWSQMPKKSTVTRRRTTAKRRTTSRAHGWKPHTRRARHTMPKRRRSVRRTMRRRAA
jgi:hypothetical protein